MANYDDKFSCWTIDDETLERTQVFETYLASIRNIFISDYISFSETRRRDSQKNYTSSSEF